VSKLFVGIDVGNKGAICLMNEDREIVEVFTMPIFEKYMGKGKDVKCRRLTNNLEVYNRLLPYSEQGYEMVIGLETLFALKSSYASLNMGMSYGLLWGALEHFGEVEFFTPAVWQRDMLKEYRGFISRLETDDLKDDSKELPIGLTRHFFGNDVMLATKRSRVPHDGIADSIWIADYLRRKECLTSV
jgi:hypothetical protein